MFHKKHCLNFNVIINQKSIHIGGWHLKSNARCLGLRRVLFLIFKIHLYQIIWLSAILAFRFAFSRLHSSGLLHVTGSLANARLRPTKNLAPFHNFYKIISLRSVFAPVKFSSKTLTSLINCYKQIQNWAVLALFYTRLTLFYRLGHPPLFYSGVFPTAVINYFALYSEAGSLPRLKLRTAYAFLPHNQAKPTTNPQPVI